MANERTAAKRDGAGRLAGKVVLVTGGTAGIGAATCRRLAAERAQVVIGGRDARRGEALARELGEPAMFLSGELTDEGCAAALVAATLSQRGRLDVLVNNAAIDHNGELLTTPMAEIRRVFEVNVLAAVAILQAAGSAMREQEHGGAIVNVGSRLGAIGVAGTAIYGASKGALLAITKTAAIELAPAVRVNLVAPGMTRTPLYEAWLAEQDDPDAVAAATAAAVPQGRIAEPEDVAAAIAYLASDDAAHVTGASLAVDGGYTAA